MSIPFRLDQVLIWADFFYFREKGLEIISEETGDSPKQVQRYIKMADLIPELLEKVDDGSMGFTPAVQIAYLKKKEQGTYFYIHCSLYNPYLNDIGRKPASFFCRLKCDT